MNSDFLSLFNGQRGWERNPQTYTPQDNGVHIADTNDQWEWGFRKK